MFLYTVPHCPKLKLIRQLFEFYPIELFLVDENILQSMTAWSVGSTDITRCNVSSLQMLCQAFTATTSVCVSLCLQFYLQKPKACCDGLRRTGPLKNLCFEIFLVCFRRILGSLSIWTVRDWRIRLAVFDWHWAELVLLLSVLTSSINAHGLVPLAVKHNHIVTLPPISLTDDVIMV